MPSGLKVFLTGASGQLGGELLVALSQSPLVGRIHCLVRPRPPQSGMARLKRVFELHGDPFDASAIDCIEGDLLDLALAARLGAARALDDVDIVIHCAAETSFSPFKSALIRATNVDGTRRILSWAVSLRRLQTFVYIGTAAICDAAQRGLVLESDSPKAGARHLVRYAESKLVAELAVRDALPAHQILTVRPSILLGDSRGLTPRTIDVHWAVAVMDRLRLLPVDPDLPLDMIPADYAARAIISLLSTERRHDVYHVSAGLGAATSAGRLAEVLMQQGTDRPRFAFIGPSFRLDLARWIRDPRRLPARLEPHLEHLARWRGMFPDRGELFSLYTAASIYFEFMQLGQLFDNARLITDGRVPPPTPAHDQLAPIVAYLRHIDLVAGARA